jgi:hypothetical protein
MLNLVYYLLYKSYYQKHNNTNTNKKNNSNKNNDLDKKNKIELNKIKYKCN